MTSFAVPQSSALLYKNAATKKQITRAVMFPATAQMVSLMRASNTHFKARVN